jgi:cholesterol transport system auxiliary component
MMPISRPIPPFLARRSLLLGSAAMVLGAGALGGCSALPINRPPPQLYTLSPKSVFPADLPVVSRQLGVDRPSSPAGLATTRIAVARGPYTIDYYAGVQWIDDAPNMVQRLLIESFENSKRIVGVGPESVALRSDFVLRIELREFQAEYAEGVEAPTINVRINAKLVRMPQRHIIASATMERLMPSRDNRMGSIVETFDEALGKVLRDIVVWTLTNPALQG